MVCQRDRPRVCRNWSPTSWTLGYPRARLCTYLLSFAFAGPHRGWTTPLRYVSFRIVSLRFVSFRDALRWPCAGEFNGGEKFGGNANKRHLESRPVLPDRTRQRFRNRSTPTSTRPSHNQTRTLTQFEYFSFRYSFCIAYRSVHTLTIENCI